MMFHAMTEFIKNDFREYFGAKRLMATDGWLI